jgi:arylsulfatase A-like enzyme
MGMEDRRGKVLREPVELRDVLPTLVDAAGGPVPAGLDGQSLLSLIRGKGPRWREAIDLEHDICYAPRNHWNALTDGRFKYIFWAPDGSEQLFDLKEDPGELHDLSKETRHQSKLKDWRQRMVKHFAERGEPFVKHGKLLNRPQSMLYSPNYPGTDEG